MKYFDKMSKSVLKCFFSLKNGPILNLKVVKGTEPNKIIYYN